MGFLNCKGGGVKSEGATERGGEGRGVKSEDRKC